MELSSAEVFLLTWASLTTISTVYLFHRARQLYINRLFLIRTLVGVGLGKVKAEMTDDGIKFEDIEEDNKKE